MIHAVLLALTLVAPPDVPARSEPQPGLPPLPRPEPSASTTTSRTASAPAQTLPFSVKGTIAPDRLQIGERAVLTLSIDAPSSLVSARPRVEDRLGELEVLGVETSSDMRGLDRWQQRWMITVTSFETGRLALPPLPFEYLAADGRTFVSSWTSHLSIEMTSPIVSADMPLRALIGRADAPPPSIWPRILAGIAAIAAAGALAGVPLARWWRRRVNRRRHAMFYRNLADELGQLAASACGDEADARVRYTRAAMLVRRGAAPIANGSIDALTSPELAARVARTAEGAGLASRLGVLLRALDSVRFGIRIPAFAQHAATLQEAQGVVSSLGRASRHRQRRDDAARRKAAS